MGTAVSLLTACVWVLCGGDGAVSTGTGLLSAGDGVEDITVRVTRPGGAGLRHNGHHAKPSTKLEDGGLDNGLKTRRWLKARSGKPPYGKTCSVRQG